MLLEGTILLDTLNLSSTANKTTEEDVEAVRWLEEQRISALSRQSLFEELSRAKYSRAFWRSLTVEEVLGQDYKQWSVRGMVLGWSAVLMPLMEVLGRDGFASALETFAEQKGVDGMVLSSVVLENPPVREFTLYCTNAGKKDAFWESMKGFVTEMEKKYGCAREEGPEHLWKTTQPWSRKGVIPLLSSFFCRVCCSPPKNERIERGRCASGFCNSRCAERERDGVWKGERSLNNLASNYD